MPDWYQLVLLALAAWRLFHLAAYDDILDRPRRHVTRLAPTWKQEGDATGEQYREGMANMLTCSFCFGAWMAIGWWLAWLVFPTETMYATVPFALSAGVVGAQRLLSAE